MFFISAPLDMHQTSERKKYASAGYTFSKSKISLIYGKYSNGLSSMYEVFEINGFIAIMGTLGTFILLMSRSKLNLFIPSMSVVIKAMFYQSINEKLLSKVSS